EQPLQIRAMLLFPANPPPYLKHTHHEGIFSSHRASLLPMRQVGHHPYLRQQLTSVLHRVYLCNLPNPFVYCPNPSANKYQVQILNRQTRFLLVYTNTGRPARSHNLLSYVVNPATLLPEGDHYSVPFCTPWTSAPLHCFHRLHISHFGRKRQHRIPSAQVMSLLLSTFHAFP